MPVSRPMKSVSAAVLLAAATITGCTSQPKPQTADVALPQYDTQTATRLAAEALQAQRAGRLDDAIELYQKAINAHPELSGIWTNLGVAYLDRGWADESLNWFGRALERDPNNIDALRGAIVAAQRSGREDEKTLERIKTLQLIETDPKWNQELGFRRARLEANLRDRGKSGVSITPPATAPARTN